MLEKLKANLDGGLFLIGIALIVIAMNVATISMPQKAWLLSMAVFTEMWLMQRVVADAVARSRGLSVSIWGKLAPGLFPFTAALFAVGCMVKVFFR